MGRYRYRYRWIRNVENVGKREEASGNAGSGKVGSEKGEVGRGKREVGSGKAGRKAGGDKNRSNHLQPLITLAKFPFEISPGRWVERQVALGGVV